MNTASFSILMALCYLKILLQVLYFENIISPIMAFMKVLSAALLLVLASPQPCCGQASTRIVGGTPVGSDRFPYFALLQGTYVRNGRVYVETCGGTLITSQVVLVRSVDCMSQSRPLFPDQLMISLISFFIKDGGPLHR